MHSSTTSHEPNNFGATPSTSPWAGAHTHAHRQAVAITTGLGCGPCPKVRRRTRHACNVRDPLKPPIPPLRIRPGRTRQDRPGYRRRAACGRRGCPGSQPGRTCELYVAQSTRHPPPATRHPNRRARPFFIFARCDIVFFQDVCRFGPKIKGFQTLSLYLWWYVRLGLVGLTKGMMPP